MIPHPDPVAEMPDRRRHVLDGLEMKDIIVEAYDHEPIKQWEAGYNAANAKWRSAIHKLRRKVE